MSLVEALFAQSGVVCLVGAGGKKSAMYCLAAAHPGRVGITATVRIPPFPEDVSAVRVVAPAAEMESAVASVPGQADVAFACPSDKRNRLTGVSPGSVARIHERAGFAATYVKADGARFRWIKAPDEGEPCLVDGASTVIPVVSARAIGQALGPRVAHHPERLGELVGLRSGEPIGPDHVARLLACDRGALKGIPDAVRVVPLINMVDDSERRELSREAAGTALHLCQRYDRVVLASLKRGQPLVDVVTR